MQETAKTMEATAARAVMRQNILRISGLRQGLVFEQFSNTKVSKKE